MNKYKYIDSIECEKKLPPPPTDELKCIYISGNIKIVHRNYDRILY